MQTAGKRLPNAGKRGQTTGDKRAIYKVLCRRLSASPKRNKCAIAVRGKRRKQEEVIGREDGDTYIAVFCDLQICGPLEKRRRHLCYFGNETCLSSQCAGELLKRARV